MSTAAETGKRARVEVHNGAYWCDYGARFSEQRALRVADAVSSGRALYNGTHNGKATRVKVDGLIVATFADGCKTYSH